MSFDLFVDRFESGRSIGASSEAFERIFGSFEIERDDSFSFRRLRFNDRGEADAYISGAGPCMFNHFGGEQFFVSLFQFLLEPCSVTYWPGADLAAAVADPKTLPELPPDMRAALRPATVRSYTELIQTIMGN